MDTPRLSLHRLLSALTACLLVCICALAIATPASAMEAVRCTGRPNSEDDPTVIMGATQSRITFEASIAEGEGVTQLTLHIPDGTEFNTEDLAVTLLTGDDLMTRNEVAYTETVDGQNLTLTFDEPIVQAGHLNVIVYDVYFPTAGGDMQVEATYSTADDTKDAAIADIPVIPVQGISTTEAISQWLEGQAWVQAWNSNRFLRLFFDPTLLVTSFPVVLSGFFMSIAIVAVSFPLAIPVALVLAFMRLSKFPVWRGIATVYVNLVRGTPLFLQLYIAFFGLPLMGVQMDNFTMGAIVLVMNSSAYLAEIFRAGIQSISQGQFEAARSLGMNGAQTMFFVIIPQTVRRVIPTMTSEFILMYKDTSLLAAVGVTELMMYAKTITAATGNVTPYIVAAGFYLIVTIPLTKLINTMEARMSNGRRKHKKGPADRSITSAASVVPDSDAGVARSIRLSETFAGPASQTDAATRIYEDAKRNGNHISH